ncbi:competence protein ComEA helix-hairpin-helix repeat region [Mucilaginibacter pineti]|uniref:Competence protein ComEA helix-hairpin-helix repeat region n=1 Tax=Mucilaginibacter pineti TaxID=1391627 RepID=A0A1G6W845_9SPHI|nr:helix-hairpin-helix domain-containing protein [Mucilaginibacter pineti]SDD61226.1 competence protein ComEA helix-hairpin-helix repeat region [Mucilaginibacter pineti]
MKAPVKNYLSVTKKEWNGMVVFVILIALVLAAPYVYQSNHKDNTINFKDFDKAAALLANAQTTGDDAADSKKPAYAALFAFNPNNLRAADWEKLGLSERQVKVIKNYEAKGGRFYTKADVKKIYTITDADYKRLEPYINIAADAGYSKKAAPGEVIEINSADSARLTMIRGIGPAFAMRIIKYRERLGGFYNKEQLKEVFGVDNAKYAEIKNGIAVNAKRLTRLNVNTATFEQLRRFPYLSFKQINAIIEFRNQHGDYESVADLKNIAILDDGILHKIAPYLVYK